MEETQKTVGLNPVIEPRAKREFKLKSGITIDLDAKSHSGTLGEIIFSKESGWGIYKVGGVNCVGVLSDSRRGITLELEGKFVENKKYASWDFQFTSNKAKFDKSLGIQQYLLREAPGCGPKIAHQIASAFGENFMDVIEKEPARLVNLKITNEATAKRLQEWAVKEGSNKGIKEKLYQIGLMPALVNKLIHEYGDSAERKIREDCFKLTTIKGIGFKTVGAIADLVGVPKDDPHRIKAGLVYSVSVLYDDGHTCVLTSELLREACALLDLPQQKVGPVLEVMLADQDLMSEKFDWKQYAEKHGIILP